MEDIKWLESERMKRPLMEDIKWMESDHMKRSTSCHAGSGSIDDVAHLYLVKSRSAKSDMSNRPAKSKKSRSRSRSLSRSSRSRSRSLSRSLSRSRSRSRSLSRSLSVHSDDEDNRSLVHDNISEPVIPDGGRVKTMPTTSRGSRNSRSQENRPTNFFIWFKQAITSFSELILLSLPPWDEVAMFIQSKNEQLCGADTTTTKSIVDHSDADSKMIKPLDGDDSTSAADWSSTSSLTNDSASKNDRSKKIFSRSKVYSSIRTRSKDYSKTPRWSSERCAC